MRRRNPDFPDHLPEDWQDRAVIGKLVALYHRIEKPREDMDNIIKTYSAIEEMGALMSGGMVVEAFDVLSETEFDDLPDFAWRDLALVIYKMYNYIRYEPIDINRRFASILKRISKRLPRASETAIYIQWPLRDGF